MIIICQQRFITRHKRTALVRNGGKARNYACVRACLRYHLRINLSHQLDVPHSLGETFLLTFPEWQIYLYTEGITAAWLGLGKLISALLIRTSLRMGWMEGKKSLSSAVSQCHWYEVIRLPGPPAFWVP